MSIDKSQIRPFRCPVCGGGMDVQNPRSNYVTCPFCGSITDIRDNKVLNTDGTPDAFKPFSFLQLGLIGQFDGITYKIIGRTRWKNDYYELEAGGYYSEVWYYDEWLLLGDDGSFFSISEDEEGYKIAKQIYPPYPSLDNNTIINNFYTGKPIHVNEYGKSTIMYFEGESTYLVQPGNYVGFAEYRDEDYLSGKFYMVEYRYDKDDKIKEVEFFVEETVTKQFLLDAFKESPQLEHIFKANEEKQKLKRKNSKIYFAAAAINIILAIIFSFITSATVETEDVINQTFTVGNVINTGQKIDLGDSSLYTGLWVADKQLDTKNYEILNIKLSTSPPPDSSEYYVALYITTTDANTIFFDDCFNYNYEDSERYAFSSQTMDKEMEIDTTGIFNIGVLVATPKKQFNRTKNNDFTLNITMRKERISSTGFFYFSAILFLIIGLITKKI